MFNLTTRQDIDDFTTGCCFFGTGGGGKAEFGQQMLRQALDAGRKIQIVGGNTISDNDWIVCPYLMGTSGPETEEMKQGKVKHGLLTQHVTNMPTAATQLLLRQSDPAINLSAVIPYEIGGAATASAIATAAWLGVPTIDADFVGRSVPEATQMLPAIYGLDLCPTASSDAFGNETIIHKTISRHMTERIGKSIASASFGLIGQATLLRKAGELKTFMLSHTLSKAFAVGKALRECREGNNQSVENALSMLTGAKKVFEGTISTLTGSDQEGYYVGNIAIQGQENDKNSELKIWFKNENHVAWLNGTVLATSPDLISIIGKEDHVPYVNNQLKEGLPILVFVTPCHQEWRKESALQAQSPRYYGFDFDAQLLG